MQLIEVRIVRKTSEKVQIFFINISGKREECSEYSISSFLFNVSVPDGIITFNGELKIDIMWLRTLPYI